MVIVAGAPYYDLAKEREGAPSYLPRCSCPFFIIYPSFFVSVLNMLVSNVYNFIYTIKKTTAFLLLGEKQTDFGCHM